MYMYPGKLKMGSNFQLIRSIYTCLIIYQLLLSVINLKAEHNVTKSSFNRDHMAVTFNPTISVLDIGHENQYNVQDLVHFIRKINSEFDQIAVEFDPSFEVHQSSRYLFPGAVAEYNKIYSSNVKLWIIEEVCKTNTLKSFQLRLKKIKQLVEETDLLCSGSIKSILLDYSCRHFIDSGTTAEHLEIAHEVFAKNQTMCNNSMVQSKIGIVVSRLQCAGGVQPSSLFYKIKPLTDFVFVSSTRQKYVRAIDESDDPLADFETLISNCFGDWQSESNNNLKIGLITGAHDTSRNGVVNFTDMVTFWDSISNWTKSSKVPVIIKSAFDRPNYNYKLREVTMGWFRLVENSSYKNPSEYIFNSKRELMLRTIKNSTDMIHGKQGNFSRNFFAPTVKPEIASGGKEILNLAKNETELIPLIRLISSRFGTLLFVTGNEFTLLRKLVRATALWNKNANDKFEMMQLFLTAYVSLKHNLNQLDLAVKMANEAEAIFPNVVAGILLYSVKFNMDEEPDESIAELKQVLETNNYTVQYKLAMAIPIKMCIGPHEKTREFLRNIAASFPTIKMLFFTAFDYYLQTGVQRTCSEITTLVETCERLMLEAQPKRNLEMGLMTNWPGVDTEGSQIFSQLVDFWETLNVWASKTNRTVIVSQAFDSVEDGGNVSKSQDGWWKLVQNADYHFPSDLVFQEKRTGALYALVEKAKDEQNPNEPLRIETVATVSSVMIMAIICTAMYFCYYFRMPHSQGLTKQELEEFFNGSEKSTINSAPYDAGQFEVKAGEFETDETSPLGTGQYSIVHSGKIWRNTEREESEKVVAVKTLNPSCKNLKIGLKGFLCEIKILAYLQKHENIVELIGAHTSQLKHGKIHLFLELCGLGSLKTYLEELYETQCSNGNREEIESHNLNTTSTEDELNFRNDFFRWSFEIASGMDYVASRKIIHADLSTRNILLTSERRAKISDFGLSRRLHNYSLYLKKTKEALPWRWMAPESLRRLEFTEKTDVWAFGVCLWEMFSMGEVPFANREWDDGFVSSLEGGLRLSKPIYCDVPIYGTMRQCWQRDAAGRPKFSDLKEILASTCYVVPGQIMEENGIVEGVPSADSISVYE